MAFIHLKKDGDPRLTFAIEYHGGIVGLICKEDVYRRSAEIGYWLGEPYWNRGFASIAIKLLTDYGLHGLDLNRIQAGVFEYNKASMRVLEKCGYKKEGIFRKSVIKNDRIFDEHQFAIIKN